MATRPTTRRTPRLESLEARQLLSADVTGEQQLMLELINEALTDPEAAAERVEQGLTRGAINAIARDGNTVEGVISEIAAADPRPPVAWDGSLAGAARRHTEFQIRLGTQTHDGPRGLETATDRVLAAGYGKAEVVAENIIYGVDSSEQAMRAFLADYGPGNADNPHRENIQQQQSPGGRGHQDVGVAVLPVEVPVETSNPFASAPSSRTETKLVVTQVFARREEAAPKIVGVVFNDANNDEFYTVGEGIPNALVTITNTSTGESTSVRTWSSGGYQAEVGPGRHRVEVRVNDRVIGRREVVVGRENVKVDFLLSDAPKAAAQVAVNGTTGGSRSPSSTPATVVGSTRAGSGRATAVPAAAKAPTASPTRTAAPSPAPATPSAGRARTPEPSQAPAATPSLPISAIDPTAVGSASASASRSSGRVATRPAEGRSSDAEQAEGSSAIALLRSSLGGNLRSWRVAESGATEAEPALALSSR